jgi:hypothetical protein
LRELCESGTELAGKDLIKQGIKGMAMFNGEDVRKFFGDP